jgi:hypothetical protein
VFKEFKVRRAKGEIKVYKDLRVYRAFKVHRVNRGLKVT